MSAQTFWSIGDYPRDVAPDLADIAPSLDCSLECIQIPQIKLIVFEYACSC